MDEKIQSLHELCETISREVEECNDKIRSAGGKLTSGDVDYLDKLTHMLKSIKTTIAMMEAEDDDGYSGRMVPMYGGGRSYADGRGGQSRSSYRRSGTGGSDNSYARGRGSNARRDSMGRYSRDGGYSNDDGMDDLLSEMQEIMPNLPEEKRREVERFVSKMERM